MVRQKALEKMNKLEDDSLSSGEEHELSLAFYNFNLLRINLKELKFKINRF